MHGTRWMHVNGSFTRGQDNVRDSEDNMDGPCHGGGTSEECQRKERRKDILNMNKWHTKLIPVIAADALLEKSSSRTFNGSAATGALITQSERDVFGM